MGDRCPDTFRFSGPLPVFRWPRISLPQVLIHPGRG